MDDIEPSAFYTGIVAELYRPLRSSVPESAPYIAFVEGYGQPALELGCGDGDPLLDLRERGLDVEGLDSSADMLERLRAAAVARGVEVVLHHTTIEAMDLGRRYRSIYLAGPTFNLLADDTTARRALERIAAHLEPEGAALVPLFIPVATPPHKLGAVREQRTPAGALLRVTSVAEARVDDARQQVTTLRYELTDADRSEVIERPWVLHWHTQDGFRALAERAGLHTNVVLSPEGGVAAPDADAFAFVLSLRRAR
ncbi:MAG: hypothetical protein QOE63_30 [Acidimicrobiaceae bacterium]